VNGGLRTRGMLGAGPRLKAREAGRSCSPPIVSARLREKVIALEARPVLQRREGG